MELMDWQSFQRRIHLATVDFTEIGMEYPGQARQIRYYPDGRPMAMIFAEETFETREFRRGEREA